jgi:hypothetical protein
MPRRVTNMSEIMKESEKYKQITQATEEKPPLPAEPASADTPIPQNSIEVKTQYIKTPKPQNTRKSDERERKTVYLDPHQPDKLEALRMSYKKATGHRINEQELIRLIIDKIDLEMLLRE